MKKRSLILTLTILVSIFFLTGCSKKVALTNTKFKEKLEKKNYTIVDVSEQYSQAEYVETVYLAQSKDKSYQIEFYVFKTPEDAQVFYENNKKIFEDKKDKVGYTEINLNTYSKYENKTKSKYNVVSIIENTAIYASIPKEKQKEVKKIIKDLGY